MVPMNTIEREGGLLMPEVVLDARVRGVDSAHSAAQAAYGELLGDLASAPALRAAERPAGDGGGTKGAVSELVLSLTASGSIAGLVKIVQLWLGRDRRRSLTVTVRTNADEAVYDLTGENVSVTALTRALEAAVRTGPPAGTGQDQDRGQD